jgi:hypothetical protein
MSCNNDSIGEATGQPTGRKIAKERYQFCKSRAFLQRIDCPGQKTKLGHSWVFVAVVQLSMIKLQPIR